MIKQHMFSSKGDEQAITTSKGDTSTKAIDYKPLELLDKNTPIASTNQKITSCKDSQHYRHNLW